MLSVRPHNSAPELLNMCDTMGLIFMDESFDMWRRRKTQNDYARFFDEWHERDLTDLVLVTVTIRVY